MEFKVGDVVVLKSGGPKMTVAEAKANDPGHVWTSWFAGAKNERARFPVAALEVPKEEPKK